MNSKYGPFGSRGSLPRPMGNDLYYDATSSQWYHSNAARTSCMRACSSFGLEGPFNTRREAEQSLADYIIWVEEGGDELVRN